MPEEPLSASAASGPGAGRRKADQDPPQSDTSLAQFRSDLIREVGKRDKAVSDLLNAKLDAHQKELLAQFAEILKRQDEQARVQAAHVTWIKARDDQDAEAARIRHEQELRTAILQGIADQAAAARKARHDRWAKYLGPVAVTLIGSLAGLLIYAGENTRALHWDARSQWLAFGVTVIVVLIAAIVKFGPF